MNKKQIIESLFGFTEATFYRWKKQNRLIITLLEKYFTKEDLEEFLESGKCEKMEVCSGFSINEIQDLVSFKERVIKAVQNK